MIVEHARNMYRGPACEVAPELFGVRGLAQGIQLFVNHAVELFNRAEPFSAGEEFRIAIKKATYPSQQVEVESNVFVETRPLHLDGYIFADHKPGAVDLPQARRRDWLLADLRKHIFKR